MPTRNRYGDLIPQVDVAAERAKIRRLLGLECAACDRDVRTDGHADDCSGTPRTEEASDA